MSTSRADRVWTATRNRASRYMRKPEHRCPLLFNSPQFILKNGVHLVAVKNYNDSTFMVYVNEPLGVDPVIAYRRIATDASFDDVTDVLLHYHSNPNEHFTGLRNS